MSAPQERETVTTMVRMFCRAHHGVHDLCGPCAELLKYADERLVACPFGDRKPACRACPVHCYRPEMRTRITEVMRYSGPRLMLHHPVMTLWHLIREHRSR